MPCVIYVAVCACVCMQNARMCPCCTWLRQHRRARKCVCTRTHGCVCACATEYVCTSVYVHAYPCAGRQAPVHRTEAAHGTQEHCPPGVYRDSLPQHPGPWPQCPVAVRPWLDQPFPLGPTHHGWEEGQHGLGSPKMLHSYVIFLLRGPTALPRALTPSPSTSAA